MEIILIALVVIIYLLNFSKNKTPKIQGLPGKDSHGSWSLSPSRPATSP